MEGTVISEEEAHMGRLPMHIVAVKYVLMP